ncbi:MAG: flagellar motor switch protein FliN [Candidatus Margulisbacteria bacterium]|nr:flagellar motor switch protein FliN [Candidatus Margulisiibacteriota bacterium]
MNKDDLKKMLEDDFFGEGDSLSGLDDISLGMTGKEEEKDVFDLDGFDFDDDDNLLGSDLDLDELDEEISSDLKKNNVRHDEINVNSKSIFDDITKDVNDILSKTEEQIEEEFESEEFPEVEDIKEVRDNNTFTNYVLNDTINEEESYLDIEESKGTDMSKNALDYNEFSDALNQEYINVKKLDFPEMSNQLTGSKFKVDLFSNIPVTIDVFLGKTTLSLKDVHDFSKGSVIELDNFYGEPLELKINGELIATGEVVAIDNKYGIMIKDIVKS